MANLDWWIDEEDFSPNLGSDAKFQKNWLAWLLPMIIIIIIAMSAASIYAIFMRLGEVVEEANKAEVQRINDLVLEAADSKDVELFTSFISDDNLSWQKAQIETVRRGRFDESPWLGFYLDQERPYRLEEITLSPDLRTASVTYTRWYQPVEIPEWSAPIKHTVFYRRSKDRWLLSPPNEFYSDGVGMFRYEGSS